MNTFLNELENETNKTYTENGALTLESTKSANVDLFFMGSALRTRNEQDIISLFAKAYAENKDLAIKNLFYIRDIRGGQGERRAFRLCLSFLAKNYQHDFIKIAKLIPEYGRWDDLISLLDDDSLESVWLARGDIELNVTTAILSIITKQLDVDATTDTPSLLAKWMPSVNTSSHKTRKLAKKISELLCCTESHYRKVLSTLRAKIKLVEQQMSAKDWEHIEYKNVPSRAAMLYSKAFYKHDVERYAEYIESVKSGKSTINASTLYPYDIVSKYSRGHFRPENDSTLQALWQNLPDYFAGSTENSICVVDTSGSMSGMPLNVAISLGLYVAERNKGTFKDSFITFSAQPKLQKIVGNDLFEKISNLSRANWDTNTDFQAIFDLILDAMQKPNVSKEDLPSRIYIISDMEFDSADNYTQEKETNFEIIRQKYIDAGFEMPVLFFWNVNSHQNNVPVTFRQEGVGLISGCSPSIFKYVLGKSVDNPEQIMLEVLYNDRYKSVVV